MKNKALYYLTNFIFLVINIITTLIVLDVFKNNFFLFQGGLGILAIIVGYISLILDFFDKEVGHKLKILSSFLLLFFYIVYAIIDPEMNITFLTIAGLTIISIFILRTIIRKNISHNIKDKELKNGKYLKLSKPFNIYIILNILLLMVVWIYPFENNLNIYEGPNGEGLTSYISEYKEPFISIDIDGGFIYNISDGLKLNQGLNADSEDLVGTVDIKCYQPNTNIKIIPYTSGTLAVNLLNFAKDRSNITVNGNEIDVFASNNDFYQKTLKLNNNEIVGDLVKSSYLDSHSNYYFYLNIEGNQEYNVEIKPITNATNSWSFYSISDLHGGTNIMVPIFKDLLENKPDFIIANGDLINSGSKSEYIITSELFNSYNIPIYTSIGNHDVWGLGNKYYPSFFGPYYYSFTYNNATFIVLNTSSGIIGESQFEWLENELQNVTTDLIFIIGHMSPINTITGEFDSSVNLSPESNDNLQSKAESDKLIELCEQYGVDYYLAGHSHVYGKTTIGNTTYVTSGVLGGTATGGNNIGYLKISVNDQNVDVTFIDSSSYYNEGILKQIQTFQVFLIPLLRAGSIRLLITLIIFTINYNIWLFVKRKLIFNIK